MNTPNKYVAAILALVLGIFGIHKFYMRKYGSGVFMLLSGVLLSWTVVVPLIIAFVAVCEGFTYAFESERSWQSRFTQ